MSYVGLCAYTYIYTVCMYLFTCLILQVVSQAGGGLSVHDISAEYKVNVL